MSDFSKLEGYDVKDAYARSEIAQMKINFQDGVDTIYNSIVAQGVTPSSSTPSACATAITQIGTTQYDNGRSQGRKDIGTNANIVSTITPGAAATTLSNVIPNHYYIINTLYARSSSPCESRISRGADLIKKSYAERQASSGVYKYFGSTTLLVKSTSNEIVIENIASPATSAAAIDLGPCQ